MRMDTLWQGEQRAARMRWWRQVVDRPVMQSGTDFDEALLRCFGMGWEREQPTGGECLGLDMPPLR